MTFDHSSPLDHFIYISYDKVNTFVGVYNILIRLFSPSIYPQ